VVLTASNPSRKVPTFLADHVEQNKLQGQLRYSIFAGASTGTETENRWAENNMIARRSPHQVGKPIAKGINNGSIEFFDKHLSTYPLDLVYVRLPSCARPARVFFFSTSGQALTPLTIGLLHQGQAKRQDRCRHY
jgi:acyl-CoA hydrolase